MVPHEESTLSRQIPGFGAVGGWVFLTTTETSWRVGTITLRITVILTVQTLYNVWSSEVILNISEFITADLRSAKNIGRLFFVVL